MTEVTDLDAFKDKGDVIWNIANLLRGPYRPPQYRRVMIPLTVLRRLDCVLEATKDQVRAMHQKLKAEVKSDGKSGSTAKYDAETIEKIINQKFKLTFHNTSEFTFQKLLGDPDKLAANLTNFIAGFSSRARKIIEKFKFEEEIEKLDEANRLFEVIKEVAAVDLHPGRIPNIAMGYLFEDLVRRFNEQANEETNLLALVQDHCEAYLQAEVLPYRPDASIDHSKIKAGYEIAFNRHFYEYEPPRLLEEIEEISTNWKKKF
jgi:type I restriction enzyme M protein